MIHHPEWDRGPFSLALNEVIQSTIEQTGTMYYDGVDYITWAVPTAVLAMPEMQAIRNLLLWYRDECDSIEDWAWWDTLPESVRIWAVGHADSPSDACTTSTPEVGNAEPC